MPTLFIPRLPVFGWNTISGEPFPSLPAVFEIHNLVWTHSGRSAIAFALQEMGLNAGDRVLVPTYHCPTMVAPIVAAGAQPLFYPISSSGAPQLDHVASLDLNGVRGMIVAHYFGLPQPMKTIREFCDQRGISLIEDCAHSMFGTTDGQAVGTWGDYAIASLTKFFPVMEGGCLASARHRLQYGPAHARSLGDELKNVINILETSVRFQRMHGVNSVLTALFSVKDLLRHHNRSGEKFLPDNSGKMPDIVRDGLSYFGVDSLMWAKPNSGTRWLCTHADRERIVTLRRRNYQRLSWKLSGTLGARPLFYNLSEGSAPYVFPLLVDNPARHYQRFRASGVPVFRWDWRWPDTPEDERDAGTQWSRQVFQIGCHQDLGIDDIDMIADTIKGLLCE